MAIVLSSSIKSTNEITFEYEPHVEGQKILRHKYYSFCYSEEHEQAMWVAYMISVDNFNPEVSRKGSFRNDPLVETKTASTRDYTNSGYDRGHLAPALDMRHNETSMYESFYMSNVSPQKPGFNRGIWKKLENKARVWALEDGVMYVTTGPVLTEFIDTIGVSNKVPVPKYYYKVLLDCVGPDYKMAAFILPNEKSDKPLYDFVVTVDSLEELTGIDFYPALPDVLEKELEREKNVTINDWGF